MKLEISKKKNTSTMYIDYKEAFDSVPHSCLLQVLQLYKIHPKIIDFLHNTMQHLFTKLNIKGNSNTEVAKITIRRGIFQGNALSPLWFGLPLNPLSFTLNNPDI